MKELHLKTENEIGRDFFTFIKNSCIAEVIKGDVYRNKRPEGSEAEDAVISVRSVNQELMQVGFVDCDIYIPDILNENGVLDADDTRAGEIESSIDKFVDDFKCDDGYNVYKDETPTLMPAEEVRQHFVHTRFKFERRAS